MCTVMACSIAQWCWMQSVANCTYVILLLLLLFHTIYIWNEGKLIDENGACIYVWRYAQYLVRSVCLHLLDWNMMRRTRTHIRIQFGYGMYRSRSSFRLIHKPSSPHPSPRRLAKSHKQQITSRGKGLWWIAAGRCTRTMWRQRLDYCI